MIKPSGNHIKRLIRKVIPEVGFVQVRVLPSRYDKFSIWVSLETSGNDLDHDRMAKISARLKQEPWFEDVTLYQQAASEAVIKKFPPKGR